MDIHGLVAWFRKREDPKSKINSYVRYMLVMYTSLAVEIDNKTLGAKDFWLSKSIE